MNDMRIEVEIGRERGDIEPLAMQLMDSAFKFYEDPENEKAFQEWKAAREARKGAYGWTSGMFL